MLKASYDKANRTSGKSYRGMPAREGCQLLAAVGREMGVAVTTDVHSPAEAELAAEWIDVLQIPAFLCRQTDLIQAAAATGRVVNVKKGQFSLAPGTCGPSPRSCRRRATQNFFFTERGVSFGYQNLVADMRSLYWMRQAGFLVCFDATHSVQRPGAGGDRTTGDGDLAPVLARAAVATGCDGVFMEVHEDPSQAPVGWPEPNSPSTTRLKLTRYTAKESMKLPACLKFRLWCCRALTLVSAFCLRAG